MRLLAQTVLLIQCLLLSAPCAGGQRSSPDSPLVLKLSVPDQAGRFHLVLHNHSSGPVHVFLGTGDGRGRQCLSSFSLLFVEASGKTHKVVPICYPVAGEVLLLEPVIAPGHEWHGDLDVKMLMVYDDPINPLSVNQLPAGSYSVAATFNGMKSGWPPRGLPYWVGTIGSAPAPYKISR